MKTSVDTSSRPTPSNIKLLQKERVLELSYDNGEQYRLPCGYLRAYSPSAGNQPQRHENINIIGIDPIGQYAIKLIFDDGHDSGIYGWDKLYTLCTDYRPNWQDDLP